MHLGKISDKLNKKTAMTNKIWKYFILLFFLPMTVQAQKVGLVLSGGGAKGLTHIGIIRALEENNIPIDYVAGTSMGAIVGSLYAMGYSPDEMEELILSDDFQTWASGKVEEEYIYYFKKNLPTPQFINIHLAANDSLGGIKSQLLPTSVVNPVQMNLAFIDLYAGATAACENNFDNLFIPFRCIASDVYNKKELILKDGDLGDAVRASMSFPLMFKPIELNGVLAYDGGIYNNFPTDVMKKDFNPDIIIGSVVASNPSKPKENDLMSQIENMVMQKTDYTLPDSTGILMTFRYDNVSLMDFQRYQELHDIGYRRTMQLMDTIKSRIHRRTTPESLKLRRQLYKNRIPELQFQNIYITGANEQQQAYIKHEFHATDTQIFGFEELKRAYFRLLSDNLIAEIIPHAVYNEQNKTYDLHLKVKLEDKFAIAIGGNISTSNSNQIYLGASYQNLNYAAMEYTLNGQLGKIYNNLQFMGKIDLPTRLPTSFRLIASLSSFDYFKKDKLFSMNNKPAFNRKDERFVKAKVALPFLTSKRAEFGFGVAQITDSYFQSNVIDFSQDQYDKSTYKILGGTISFNGNSLNSKQFPTLGIREELVAQIYTATEQFKAGKENKSASALNEKHNWLQLSYTREMYHKMTDKWRLGWYLEAYYSSRNFSDNYSATMMQAGEFAPTAHSRLTYNEAFRANQFAALGVIPIYRFNQSFHVRAEFYGFLPIYPIERNSINKAYYGKAFSRFEYLGEFSLVYELPFGAISAYVNHYSSPAKEWNVGLSIGWQLFNYRFFE